MGKIRGHIDGLLVRQTSLTQRRVDLVRDGHIVLDEGGSGIGFGNPCPDVEGVRSPQGREDIGTVSIEKPLSMGSVTGGAILPVEILSLFKVWNKPFADFPDSPARNGIVAMKVAVDPVHIGQHGGHGL